MIEFDSVAMAVWLLVLALMLTLHVNTAPIELLDTDDLVRSPNCTHVINRDPESTFVTDVVPAVGEYVQLEYDLLVANLGNHQCAFNMELQVDDITHVNAGNYTYGIIDVQRPTLDGNFFLTAALREVHRKATKKDSIFGSWLHLLPPMKDMTVQQNLTFVTSTTVNQTVTVWETDDPTKKKRKSLLLTVPEIHLFKKISLGTPSGEFSKECLAALHPIQMCTTATAPVKATRTSEDTRFVVLTTVGVVAGVLITGVGLGLLFLFWNKICPRKKVDGPASDPIAMKV